MTTHRVRVYVTDDTLEQRMVGTIGLDGGRLVLSPPDNRVLNGIASRPVRVFRADQMEEIHPAPDPLRFLTVLHEGYSGTRVRCSKVEPVLRRRSGRALGDILAKYPGQPRDDHGRFAEGGAGGAAPSPESALGEPIVTPAEADLPKKVRHRYRTEAEIRRAAQEAQVALEKLLDHGEGVDGRLGARAVLPGSGEVQTVLNTPGPAVIVAPVKSTERAAEKVATKFVGDWGQLTDMVRGRIVVDGAKDIVPALRALRLEAAENGFSLATAPEDRVTTPTPVGYRDVVLKLFAPNGLVTEVQIVTKSMVKASDGIGHHIYEKLQKIERAVQKRGDWTPELEAEHGRLAKESEALYRRAWEESK